MAETWVRWKVWLIWRAYIYIEIAVAAAMEEFGGKFWRQRKKKSGEVVPRAARLMWCFEVRAW